MRNASLQAPSGNPAAAERKSAVLQSLDRRRRAGVFDVLAETGIRVNQPHPDSWDLVVTDENRFVRGITSPLNNGEFRYYYYRTLMAWNDNFEKVGPKSSISTMHDFIAYGGITCNCARPP